MIRTILVPITGRDTDAGVFASALAVARPLAAHLDFYHARFTPCDAAMRSRHVEFCVGAEINVALDRLRRQEERHSLRAAEQFLDFCQKNSVPVRSTPDATEAVSAELLQETDHAESRLMVRARHSDMVVIGRPAVNERTPYSLIELLLLGSGRPILIASEGPRANVTDTIVIGWKESSEAAHSLASAMPLLKLARRVVLAHIGDDDDLHPDTLNQLCVSLLWHGVAAETRFLVKRPKPALQLLEFAADVGAGLLVVGGYGHKALREAIFGGITRALIEQAELPVFLMH
jgi:nucleotide-binding universal stress UspA family protein